MIQAGLMRERIIVEYPTESRSALGESTIQWATFAEVYAQVDGMSARDALQAMQANVIVTHRMRIRFLPGLTHEHRVIWRGRRMEIASVLEREIRTVHEILCREVV
jgi:hypothetical protein